jgi:polyhydroxyalkanoate synthesis regulator phasin
MPEADKHEPSTIRDEEDCMKRFWKIAGIAAVVLVLGTVGIAVVAAQGQSDDGSGLLFDVRQRMHEAIAEVLGIGVDEYDAAVDSAREQVLQQAVDEGVISQDTADRMLERSELGFGPGMMRGGAFGGRHGGAFGPMGGPGAMMGGPENSLVSVAAEQLGITVDELVAQLQDGKSVATVAQEYGVEPQSIADAFLAERADWLAQAVADGRLSQEQADWMLDHMTDEVQEHLTAPYPFGGPGEGDCGGPMHGTFRRGGGPGRLWSFPGQSEG